MLMLSWSFAACFRLPAVSSAAFFQHLTSNSSVAPMAFQNTRGEGIDVTVSVSSHGLFEKTTKQCTMTMKGSSTKCLAINDSKKTPAFREFGHVEGFETPASLWGKTLNNVDQLGSSTTACRLSPKVHERRPSLGPQPVMKSSPVGNWWTPLGGDSDLDRPHQL